MNEHPIADFVLTGAGELVTCAVPAPAAGPAQSQLPIIEDAALAAKDGRVVWVGHEVDLERQVQILPGATTIDVRGRAVLPGLVDCHTHLVWDGDRADEFERRLAGATYAEIAAAGGGILRTVEMTRRASLEELAEAAGQRMDRMARWGVTAFEVKSGYGLDLETELKMLRAARLAADRRPFEVVTTFLGAHTVPKEARGSAEARAAYVERLCREMIPRVAAERLAQFADVFVDAHAFSIAEARLVLAAARRHGLALKIHADQLASDGSAELAGELGAVSAEHLEFASEEGMRAMAAAGTVAVLLPAAGLFIRMKQTAPARKMIDLGVPVALSTDLNPGSCPCESLPLVLQLGCLLYGMTVEEAILAGTLNAAAAAGIADRAGSLEPGKRCDLLVLDAEDRRQLLYQFGAPRIFMVVAGGRIVS